MLKSILFASSVMIAAPVIAQTAPATGQTAPTGAPTTALPATTATPQTGSVPATPTTAAPTGTVPAQSAQTTATPAATTTEAQVAQVVDQQFATYDKDANGTLSKAEFAAWMTALKSSSPTAKTGTPAEETAWNDAAFKQADGDQSTSVTKTELTGFLVKGSSGAS